MQDFQLDILWTRLRIRVDTSRDMTGKFSDISEYLANFERRYSRFIPGNWLDTVNQSGGGVLDSDSRDMLLMALDVARKTDGIFDPTVWARLTHLGYGAQQTALAHCNSGATYENVSIDGNTLTLTHGAMIEFGWVGKWFALGRVVSFLSEEHRFLVDFGGDIYGKGGWRVWLEDPQDFRKAIGMIVLENGYFCSSSGSRRRFRDSGNQESHHLIDAKTWKSVHHCIATYIESDDGMMADSYATACFVVPLDRALALLQNEPIEGVLVDSERRTYRSENSRIELFT